MFEYGQEYTEPSAAPDGGGRKVSGCSWLTVAPGAGELDRWADQGTESRATLRAAIRIKHV